MTAGKELLSLMLPAEPPSVGKARHAVAAVAEEIGMPESALGDLKTIVTEACSNVVLHAYPDVEGTFTVVVMQARGELSVVVRDFGVGMARGPAAGRESLRLGLALISTLSKSHAISRPADGGIEVRMVVSLED